MTLSDSSKSTVAVIGAGMTGITCARALADAGFDVTVFEKSRGLGGRMATRRVGKTLTIDHGAQFITARSDAFKNFMQRACKAGTAAIWTPKTDDADKGADDDWYVGRPRMNSFLKPLAQGLNIREKATVSSIERDEKGWRITCAKGEPEVFDRVICTTPVDQARNLLASELSIIGAMKDVTVAPCWALLIASEARLRVDSDVLRNPTPDIAWMAKNNTKPGRGAAGSVWVVHASVDWSRHNLEMDKDDAIDALLALVADVAGSRKHVTTYESAHRWRYAQTETPLGQPFISSDNGTLFIGGDWCLGARVEYAYQSGTAIAEAVISAA
jgi:renalase